MLKYLCYSSIDVMNPITRLFTVFFERIGVYEGDCWDLESDEMFENNKIDFI